MYFSFKVDSIDQISEVFFFKSEDPKLQDNLKAIIFNLPKMVSPIDDGIAGTTEFILKLQIIPETRNIFSIIDIKTKFDKSKKESNENLPAPALNIIQEVPVFLGCAVKSQQEQRLCFQNGVLSHINKNFRYPKFALENGLQGKVYISFILDKEGDITYIRTRGPHPSSELEDRRIFSTFPKVEQGMIDGAPVRVPFSIPITFAFQ